MRPPIQVFTARYSNPNVGQSGLAAVGISRYSPRFRLPYSLAGTLKTLAPSSTILAARKNGSVTLDQFITEYEQQLERVGLDLILQQLGCLQGDAPGIVLLCFEDVTAGEICHRTMLAAWMKQHGGPLLTELVDPGKKELPKRPRPVGGTVRRELRESRDEAATLLDGKSSLRGRPLPKAGNHPACGLGLTAARDVLDRPPLSRDLESEVAHVLVRWAVQILRATPEAGGA